MENLKLKLFNFKKELTLDQEDISKIVEGYIDNFTYFSEKEIINNLNEQLSVYTFDAKVKSLVEGLSTDLSDNELLYDLKNLYKIIERKNQGQVHRHPLQVILNIINEGDNQLRMQKIVNELSLYDWIYEVRSFMLQFSATPVEKENLKNGGNIEPVYTVVEKVEEGHVVFVKDKWFLLSENSVAFCNLEDHIKDTVKLKQLRVLEQALKIADIDKDKICFDITEDLTIGVGSKNGKIYLNDDEIEAETSLENVFSSPLVPFLKADFYPVIKETVNNVKKFVEFDVAMKVSNIINMHAESFVFNYKDKIYNYTCDNRYGNSLYEYDSVMELVSEMKNNYDFDVTYFYQNKLSEEVKQKRNLEDREKEITVYLEEVNENIDVLNNQIKVMEGNDLLEKALDKLLLEKAKKEKALLVVKKEKNALTTEKKVVRPEKINELFNNKIKKAEKGFWDKYKAELKVLKNAEKEGGDKLKEIQKDLKTKLKADWSELGKGLKGDQKNVLRKDIEDVIFNVNADDRRSLLNKITSGSGVARNENVEAVQTIEELEAEVEECLGCKVDLKAFCDYYKLTPEVGHECLCKVTDEEVKKDLAEGDFTTFELEEE